MFEALNYLMMAGQISPVVIVFFLWRMDRRLVRLEAIYGRAHA